jgi:hypothetical protein
VAFLALPVAVFEIILLPFWLLFRGFQMPEAPDLSLPPAASVEYARAEDRTAFADS